MRRKPRSPQGSPWQWPEPGSATSPRRSAPWAGPRGYGINTDYGGHGVGRTMHEAPSVPNEGSAGRGRRLLPGLVIAIEPWFLGGGHDDYRVDDDGWTLRSVDGSRGAHVEHTIAVTATGPRILTSRLAG